MQVICDVSKHMLNFLLRVQVLNNFFIQSGQRPKLSFPIRVWQTPDIVDYICIDGYAILEAELMK